MRRTILLLLGITLSACVQEQPTLTTTAAFNPAEVAWATRPGTNTVQGFAVLRTVGGEARTCAGLEMRLIPDSSYARERMMSLYGNLSVGSRPIGGSRFGVTDSDYLATSKSARCDGQGNFTFEQIAAQLEISPNTAASRYRYALAALREALTAADCHG